MEKKVNVCDFPHDTDVIATDTYDIKLNGSTQHGDICEDHQLELGSLLETLVPMRAAARAQRTRKTTRKTTAKRRTRKTTAKRRTRKFTDRDVREWAAANKVAVNQYGRIPNAIKEQFLASK